MIISDLSHLEIINKVTPIFGGAGTTVSAGAVAVGNSTLAHTEANTWARATSPNGGSVSVGQSTGLARGDDLATTSTSGEAYGDIAVVVSVNDPMAQGMAKAPIDDFSRSKTVAVAVNIPPR